MYRSLAITACRHSAASSDRHAAQPVPQERVVAAVQTIFPIGDRDGDDDATADPCMVRLRIARCHCGCGPTAHVRPRRCRRALDAPIRRRLRDRLGCRHRGQSQTTPSQPSGTRTLTVTVVSAKGLLNKGDSSGDADRDRSRSRSDLSAAASCTASVYCIVQVGSARLGMSVAGGHGRRCCSSCAHPVPLPACIAGRWRHRLRSQLDAACSRVPRPPSNRTIVALTDAGQSREASRARWTPSSMNRLPFRSPDRRPAAAASAFRCGAAPAKQHHHHHHHRRRRRRR